MDDLIDQRRPDLILPGIVARQPLETTVSIGRTFPAGVASADLA
jgi:hypothetical protein